MKIAMKHITYWMNNMEDIKMNDDMKMNIKLDRIIDIKAFVETAASYPYHQTLIQGHYRVDAKSILGVMSLDLTKPVLYVCDTNDDKLKADMRFYMAADQTMKEEM